VDDFDEAFAAWLRDEAGIAEPRRVVRRGAARIVVSKFEEGFAARLQDSVSRVPELLQGRAIEDAYSEQAALEQGATRVTAWQAAALGVVRSLASERELSVEEVAEIAAGVDSVAALLDSILWTGPTPGDGYQAGASEQGAMGDALARMDADTGKFTRYYGTFRGARVENYCPGSQVARALLAQAWRCCTGQPLPGAPPPIGGRG